MNHFLAEEELFTPKNLSKILSGLGLDICPTFAKLHDFCFDKVGSKTNYLKKLIKNNPSDKILELLYEKVRKATSTSFDVTFLQQQNISRIKKNKVKNCR